ncbi:MAG: glycogen debranching protein GlgX [Actinomycetaceae bacterium]|nr:glycogen debranching protein GlgX [Actinomycetaceae bacterium]
MELSTESDRGVRIPENTTPARNLPAGLGAHLIDDGADFAVMAPHASSVTLCLFERDATSAMTERRYALNPVLQGLWAGFVPGVGPGQLYGYRVDGRWAPESGLLHNPAKLLLDPYARAIEDSPRLHPALYSHTVSHLGEVVGPAQSPPDPRDSAPYMSLGVVTAEEPHPASHPYTPWDRTVIYEGHVKGLTALAPGIPAELRGTYAGLGHPAMTDYLRELGITAIELLPIHAKMAEPFLTGKGLDNYWGYNTLSYFAPEPSYATEASREAGPLAVVAEVKAMIESLHAAGIEVILDVVYNHTCEGGIDGPTVSWRGLDQTTYYMPHPHDPGKLMDTTGCGNSLDFRRQAVIRMTLDSLRYWVSEMGVDGFRFDLAVTLGRNGQNFDPNHPFYVAMSCDPVVGSVKLINEPWDLGPDGWRTGQFTAPTADWNDHFRNTARSFWVSQPRSLTFGGHGGDMRDLATRLAGSADHFGHGRIPGGRGTYASINFVTAHDGFTLRDLVSYDVKHNEANLEDNRDGNNDNLSWNHGHEGSEDAPPDILAARRKTIRNLLGMLALSAGTPMITAGDEFGRTQLGNNNAYCQDNELAWVHWNMEPWQKDLYETSSYLLRLRREHPVLRPTGFYTEYASDADAILDLEWYDIYGEAMPQYRWFDPTYRTLQMLRSGGGVDADALIVFNGSIHPAQLRLPVGRGVPFELVWDSTWERPRPKKPVYTAGAATSIGPLSVRLYLAWPASDEGDAYGAAAGGEATAIGGVTASGQAGAGVRGTVGKESAAN